MTVQLIDHIISNRLCCFVCGHSTETVIDDFILATENGQTSVLLFLDVTAAFNTADFLN